VLLLLFQLLFLLVLLVVNGEPLRAVFLRRLELFSDLDFVQVCIIDVYVGGLILYVLAILPFGLFSWVVVVCFTLLSAVLSIVIHAKTIVHGARLSRIRAYVAENKKALLIYLAVFLMFMVFLVVNLSSLSGLVLGSVRDESIHSLDVQVILENHSIPLTLQPYLTEGIIYPQASHVIFAFASYMLNMNAAKVVFYVTVLFKALSVLGAYFLGRKLGHGVAIGLSLSFVFAFVSSWPLNVTWGGNPFLVGFPFFLVCLGLLFSLFRFRVRHNLVDLVTVGLLFGYVGTIIISYLQVLMAVTVLVFLYYLVCRQGGLRRVLGGFAAVLGVSFLPLSPFIYRFFVYYQYPGHNIGMPQDFTGWTSQQVYFGQALQWFFDNLSPYAVLKVLIFILLAIFAILLWRTRDYKNVKPAVKFALVIFAAATLLSFVAFFLPADFGIVSWGHQGIILTVPVSILIAVSFVKFAESFREGKIKRLSKIFPKGSGAALLLAITILALVTSPFLYYRFAVDPKTLRGSYNVFSVTTQSDYDLMTWMSANLSSDAVVLVHPFGSGLFIPSVSHHRIVFPYSGSSLSGSYQTLVGLLENGTLNANAYEIMRNWNVSYVFVGSNVALTSLNPPIWNPELFLGNPNFKLVKNFGNSYLFKIEEYNQSVIFMDNFEYPSWNLNGWLNYSWGKGLGNVTIKDDGCLSCSKQLAITAQALPTEGQWELQYSYWIERDIFVPYNDSEVMLSFYLNATQGFGKNDTFALLISNVQHSRMMVIATPNGVYQGYPSATILGSREGSFSYDLSAMWQRMFNSSLPQTFVLQLVNYDFDGVPSVAYVDNITVTSTPATTPLTS
jgi:hypothetical protein